MPVQFQTFQAPYQLTLLARKALLLLATAVLLQACGGGGASSSASSSSGNATPAGQKAQATVGSAGGTVLLSSSDGVQVELSFPAGALVSDTPIIITTVASAGTQRLSLGFEPAGLLLQGGQQAVLTITLAPGQALPASGGLVYDGAPIAFDILSDGRLQAKLGGFAAVASVASVVAARAVSALDAPGATMPSPRALASIASACGGIPQASGYQQGTLSVELYIELDIYGQCMVSTVNALAASGQYAAAVRVASAVAALLQRAGLQGGGLGSAQNFINQAGSIACAALHDRIEAAKIVVVTTTGSLYPAVKPVLFWQAIVEKLGATCNNVGATEYQDVIQAQIAESLVYYQTLHTTVEVISSTAYQSAAQEGRDGKQALDEVRSLRPQPALENTLKAQVEQKAQASLLDAILQAPFKACRDSGDVAALAALLETFGSPESVRRAAQYCGATLNAVAKDASGIQKDALNPALGGSLNGQTVSISTSGSLVVTQDGTVELSGPIEPLRCPSGQTGGSESLEIRFNGALAQTLPPPYLQNTVGLPVASLLSAAGLQPGQVSAGTLTLTRTGSPCKGFWGSNPQPLFTLTIGVKAPDPALKIYEECFFFQPNELTGASLPLFPNRADFITLGPLTVNGRQLNIKNLGENYRGEFQQYGYQVYLPGDGPAFDVNITARYPARRFVFTFSKDEAGRRRVAGALTQTTVDAVYVSNFDALCDLDMGK